MEPAKLVLVFENFSLRACVIVWCYGNFFNIESSLLILCCVKKCRVRYNIFSERTKTVAIYQKLKSVRFTHYGRRGIQKLSVLN